jgi:thiol-disulfide isomerase/thioredoxin
MRLKANLWKFMVPGLVVIALCVVAMQVIKARTSSETASTGGDLSQFAQLEKGSTLHDFRLKTLDGKSVLASKLGAKVVLLNFWATWCEACMVEMPSIIKLQDLYKDQGLQVAAVDLDDEPLKAAPKTIKKLGFNFPVYSDTDGVLSNFFDIHAIPLTIVLSKDLKILLVENSERDWTAKGFREELNQWLKQ